ncbi:hypothetical protein [Pseudomonas denitrificans (nom. rej.)]|uniref:Uncharacterized protein n=1 Tax=Pseudomonas denitrificans TaxID=43306 RepID=A0A9X7N6F6_PSEDE|nr:hypothetical protein [Pseudomonas denitrificans (nom. rej.)]QEY75769.1 hypothetical protein F1C79_31390 [Pseudomonas denitrificans (nom. rej.)]
MPDILLLIANKGTSHELTISDAGDELYCLDNTPDRLGKTWYELPRIYRSVRGCKLAAAKLLGEPQKWISPAQGGDANGC